MDATDGLPLRQFIEPLLGAEELHLSLGSDAAGHQAITALPRATIEAWMAEVARDYDDMDARTRAAYLIGDIAWAFSLNLAALHLAGRGLPDIGPDTVAAAPQWYRWEEDGESGEALRFTLHLLDSPDAIVHGAGAPLANKQTGFIEIVVRDEADPQQVLGCEWFRARGGCCRYYTTGKSAGEYCSTCVLRPAESRDKRLHDYVRGKLLASA